MVLRRSSKVLALLGRGLGALSLLAERRREARHLRVELRALVRRLAELTKQLGLLLARQGACTRAAAGGARVARAQRRRVGAEESADARAGLTAGSQDSASRPDENRSISYL